MPLFRKRFLQVGEYPNHLGDVLIVTRQRLRHWCWEFSRMRAGKLVLPVHLGHPDDRYDSAPVPRGDFRSAADTVGKVHSFVVAGDGDAAVITLALSRADAVEGAEANTLSASPVVVEYFRDGRGRVYHDVIISVDLVTRPADTSQSSFVPVSVPVSRGVVAMSSSFQQLTDRDVTLLRKVRAALPAEATAAFDKTLLDLFSENDLRAITDGDPNGKAADLVEVLQPDMLTMASRPSADEWRAMTPEKAKRMNDQLARETPGVFKR